MRQSIFTIAFVLQWLCTAAQAQNPLDYVDPLIGTGPARTISALRHSESSTEDKGQTFPAVGRPFGMTQWTPETRTTETKCVSPYYYVDTRITGFRASHWMSGSCTQDYGSFTIMPFSSERPDTVSSFVSSAFSHDNETASPAYYRVLLSDCGISAELTASQRSGMLRFTFPGDGQACIIIRSNSDEKEGKTWYDSTGNVIYGINPVHRIYQGWGKPAGFSGCLAAKFDQPLKGVYRGANGQDIILCFGNIRTVTVTAGTSFTSVKAALQNLETEIPSPSFDRLRTESRAAWEATLSKIKVKGGSAEDLTKFYTALYHCYQLPRIASDCDGTYQGFAQDTLVRNTGGFDYYDDFSMWDTYRALHPLMTILEPAKTLDMVKSLVLKAEQGGWMPIFPAWGSYTAAMIGDHVSTTIADAYLKGIRGFDAGKAYFYMRKNAFEIPPRAEYVDGKGRRALGSYMKYGYIPLEDSVWDAFHRREQVSRTLEYAFDDYALARFARALGREDDYRLFSARAANWKNVFDGSTGFARGRHADGRWVTPFDPFKKAPYICEGTPFQYTWYVPHDIPGLIAAMGGREPFLERLNEFFDKGHYWHGNETDHQAAYIFAMAGESSLTREWVTKIVNEEYGTGPGGLSGNEDAGQMSAWLVFSMMGFYPVCPASNEYVAGIPAFEEVSVSLPGGKTFTVRNPKASTGIMLASGILRNGRAVGRPYITHEDITAGSTITFMVK